MEMNEKQALIPGNSHSGIHGNSHRGLSVCTASLFILGEIVGGGALALPMALTKSGLTGLFVLFVVLLMNVYGGDLLGKSWWKIKENRVDMEPIRDPYPFIGELAGGQKMRYAVTIILGIFIVSSCIVYILLAAETFSTLVSFHIPGDTQKAADLRIWLVIVISVIFPLMLLGTPKDNWIVALVSVIAAVLGLILVWIKYVMIYNSGNVIPIAHKQNITTSSYLSAFGTYSFSMSGASLFLTIQTDMENPAQITKSICIAYLCIALLYVPTAVGGYVTVHWLMKDSVFCTLKEYDNLYHDGNTALVTVASLLFAINFIGGVVLYMNPIMQHYEEFLAIPYEFTSKRIASRSTTLLILLAIAQLFPKFGPLLDLAGGSFNIFICFIFPVWFYTKLFPDRKRIELFVSVIVVILAMFGGVMSTITNVINVVHTFHNLYGSNSNTTLS